MTAVKKDLYIEQGATFFLGFAWHAEDPANPGQAGDPYDLTGCTARMQVRRKQGDPVLVTATSSSTGVGADRIKLGGVNGRIEITLTDEDTDLMSAKSAVYDLEVEWPIGVDEIRPRVDRLLEGSITVSPNVTQVDGEDPVAT